MQYVNHMLLIITNFNVSMASTLMAKKLVAPLYDAMILAADNANLGVICMSFNLTRKYQEFTSS